MRLTRSRTPIIAAILLLSLGCAGNRPPNLSPSADLAYTDGRIVGVLDIARDVATAGYTFTPSQFPLAATRAIVQGHSSALVVIEQRSAGWQIVVTTTLQELQKNLPPATAQLVGPYFALANVLLTAIANRAIDEPASAAVIAAYKARLISSQAIDRAWLAAH